MSATNPTFVRSASYTPCHACGEGSLTWDETRMQSTCANCGAVSE
jgi:transcription initiation factor TFIIIB Brf1 subunit/transcription initiation factor TFIIB